MRTTVCAHSILHKALAEGVHEGVLAGNLAGRAILPSVSALAQMERSTVHSWHSAQLEGQ